MRGTYLIRSSGILELTGIPHKGNNEIISQFAYQSAVAFTDKRFLNEAFYLYRRGGKASRLPSREVNGCPSLPGK